MNRPMGLEDTEVFRAIIEVVHPPISERGEYRSKIACGPYRTVGAARAAVTRETTLSCYRRDRGVTTTGRVE